MLPFITDTNRKYKRQKKKQTLRQQRGKWFQGNVMHPCCMCCNLHVSAAEAAWVMPEASVLHSAEMRVQKWGRPHFGQDLFFCCPENRPWFPGTMQLIRLSPRKIRLWHHGFLKHKAEPTLSPAIIKPQWISTVDWNWERGRISLVDALFFFFFFFALMQVTECAWRPGKYEKPFCTVFLLPNFW